MRGSSPQGAPIDRYVVLQYLAEGGMGAIYLGKKMGAGGFEKEVVLKQLLPEFTSQPEFIDLFLREARLSATLDHANIIHTIDLVTAGAEYFIVMEYLAGADLRSLLKKAKRRRRRMSAAAAIYIGREVLSALAYAHSKMGPHGKPLHLIHRDVSPSNILVSRNGEVKLTDFGIAKASTHNSVFYRVKGKVGYMSPEQAHNEPLDNRSDLYSLAVCMYEAITGERLFVHAGLTTSAEEIYGQPIPAVSRKVPGLPSELDRVMLKALAVDRNDRYQTASEFQEALLRCAHRCGLMISAPELAVHLEETCGPAESWRNIDESPQEPGGSGGTEIYEPEGTEQIDFNEDSDVDDLISVVHSGFSAELVNDALNRRKRAQTSLTNLTRLQGLELTSMINIADMGPAGAEPLVDLEELGGAQSLLHGDDSDPPWTPPTGLEVVSRDPSDSFPQQRLESEPIPRTAKDAEASDTFDEFEDSAVFEELEERRPSRGPWLILLLILVVGIAVTVAVGLSGPRIDDSSSGGSGTSSAPK